MATVRIAYTLPLSLVLSTYPPYVTLSIGNPAPLQSVTINGFMAGRPTGVNLRSGVGLTDVDATFWALWLLQNPTFPAIVSGALYQTS